MTKNKWISYKAKPNVRYRCMYVNIFSVNSSAVDAVTCFDVQVAVDICKNIAAIYQMINDHKMGQTISISIYKTPTLEMK